MYIYKLIPTSINPAHGGPAIERPKEQATPTRAGRYVVGLIGPHTSPGRWPLSAVPWGTPIRLNKERNLTVYFNGKWVLLNTLPGWKEQYPNSPELATAAYVQAYRQMMHFLQQEKYGLDAQSQMPAPWNGPFPNFWNVNDFGRVAVKYFKDTNDNRKLDGKETLLSDFIHTTPYDEMEALLSKKLKPVYEMTLGESHGCIHMVPAVLQDWIAKKILVVGATLEVHPYSEKKVLTSFERATGRVGREIHFYPHEQKIALYNVSIKQAGGPLHVGHE